MNVKESFILRKGAGLEIRRPSASLVGLFIGTHEAMFCKQDAKSESTR
jgi:hypothetical protein